MINKFLLQGRTLNFANRKGLSIHRSMREPDGLNQKLSVRFSLRSSFFPIARTVCVRNAAEQGRRYNLKDYLFLAICHCGFWVPFPSALKERMSDIIATPLVNVTTPIIAATKFVRAISPAAALSTIPGGLRKNGRQSDSK